MRQKSVGNPPAPNLILPRPADSPGFVASAGEGPPGWLSRSPLSRAPTGGGAPWSQCPSQQGRQQSAGCPWELSFPDSPSSCPERRSPTRRTGPGPEGRARHLMSGLGVTHLENRQRPNFRLSPASLRCPHGTLLKSICQRENPFLPKWLVHCLVVTEELVRQMNHGHKVGCIEQNGCRTRAHWRSWILQDGSRTATGSQRSSQVSEHKPLAGCGVIAEPRTRKEAVGQAGRVEGRQEPCQSCYTWDGCGTSKSRQTSGTLHVGTQRGGLTGGERSR